ncbi:MAG: AbgT family transporter [Limnoraphis robusta]|uniref:C4-dicarboxylate ABC transporter n=2 Tax=Limnoraphis robusta CS-951 TaxID=1637645 RepID=A0A0J9HNJ7_9CYAN|nr:AbgT family transporter [Limnoraphis robusta]KMW70754.1 C4-dicarboxylate ABC transporter [Limnoraphis robusta CS-951]
MNKFKLPDTLVISSFILLLVIVLTWIIPAGEYSREIVENRSIVVPGSYQVVTPAPQNILNFFIAPVKGFISATEVIAFIFFVGGAFGIVNATGAIDAGLEKLVNLTVRNPAYKWVIIPLLILAFSFCGGSFGMSEEILVFVLITIPLAQALGYDTITGVAIPFVGAGVGFAGAFLNPFTVGVAQGIAQVPLFSGIRYRLLVWAVFSLMAIAYILWYIYRQDVSRENSLLYSVETATPLEKQVREYPLTVNRIIVLILFFLTILILGWGVTTQGWYITEIAGLFFALGIFSSLIGGLSLSQTTNAFVDGAKEMMMACLIVGFCKGILIVATEGKIIDTILFQITQTVESLPTVISVQAMFWFQAILNFFVPSGSGQAALTMPIMAPLSDLLGISRQTAVLAFQMGDGLNNLIIPTSGVTMGVLSIAKIPYEIWLRWIMPLMVYLFLGAMFFLFVAVKIGWS